jgi:pyrroline-5-carboxylate reductase
MAAQSDSTIKQLIDAVTSPNGTTEAGLKSLNNNNFDQTIISCLEATVNRAEELSK